MASEAMALERQTDEGGFVTIRRLVKFTAAALSMSVLLTMPAQATTEQVVAEVRRTLTVADERFGGCMVALSVSPSENGTQLPGG